MTKIRKASIKDFGPLVGLRCSLVLKMSGFHHKRPEGMGQRELRYIKGLVKKNLQKEQGNVYLVAEEGGHAIGYSYAKITADSPVGGGRVGEIEEVFVLERYRRKGVGKRLVKKAMAMLRKKGAKRFGASVHMKNKASLRLLRHFGFKENSVWMGKG